MQKTGFETSDVIAGGVPKMAAESETCASQMAMDVNDDLEKYGEDISLAKDGGVRKIIKKEGSRKDRPPVGSKVRVYYRGTFLNGEEFDSNVGRKEPFEFEVGKGVVIRGWDIAVPSMSTGEKSLFTIKPEYAYGKEGSSTKIPPNSTLRFEIELVQWKGEDLTKDCQVTKIILEKGEGYEKPNTGASCNAHILGKYNDKVFEDREVSFLMREGAEEGLLPGVEEAMSKMCDGEKAHVWIHPGRWGFGAAGKPEFDIPGEATLEYIIHLRKYENSKENWELSNEEKITLASSTKEKGTKYFKEGKYNIASHQYTRVIRLLDGFFNNEEKEKRDPLMLVGHLNLAACHLKLNNNFKCIKECEKALEIEKQNIKALFRRGKARLSINELELAKKDFELVLKIDPNNREAQQQLNFVNKKIKQHTAKEKVIFANMFERLARKEELETAQAQRRDVFKEATDEEMRKISNSSDTSPLPATSQGAPSTEVNGQGNTDVEMKEDDKGGVMC